VTIRNGSWSIKKVQPVLLPGTDPAAIHHDTGPITYDDLDGCARGDQAAMMLFEYVRPETSTERREEIRAELLPYCELDTKATVDVLGVLRDR
jgi:hypothetical protein